MSIPGQLRASPLQRNPAKGAQAQAETSVFRASMGAAGTADDGDLNEGYDCITDPFDAGYSSTPAGGTHASC